MTELEMRDQIEAEAIQQAEEYQAKYDATISAARERGQAEAVEDWKNDRAVVYYGGGPTYWNGFDPKTGLNLEQKAGCVNFEPDYAYISGYNDHIKAMIAEHGLPTYSRKTWSGLINVPEQVFDQDLDWNTHAKQRLSYGGDPRNFGDLLLHWCDEPSGEDNNHLLPSIQARSAANDYVWIVVSWVLNPQPHETIDVVFGPPGSEIAFLRIQPLRTGNPRTVSNYATLDVRNGRWLYVENRP